MKRRILLGMIGMTVILTAAGCGSSNSSTVGTAETQEAQRADTAEADDADMADADSTDEAEADSTDIGEDENGETTEPGTEADAETVNEDTEASDTAAEETSSLPHIYLRLGETDDRPSYEIALLDNEVSERFIRILQDQTRVIPLYVFDGSEHTDVLQYYDIPSSYDVPDGSPQMVTEEKAGEVYYSEGRIMIFYQDAEIEGNYVKIGDTLTTEGLKAAVDSNPLDEWGNRRVTIGLL